MKGHVRERGAGHWYAVIEARDPASGKRKRKWVSLPDAKGKREAQIACAKIIAGGVDIRADKATLAEFLERWLGHIETRVSPRTFERYAEIVRKNIVPAIGAAVLAKLTAMQISEVYDRALKSGRRDGKGGLSARSVHHMHRILRQALAQAVKWDVLTRNPADAATPPKVERRSMQTLDMAQSSEYLTALRDTRMFIPTVLGLLCGMRLGEIAALRWGSVDLDGASLAVVRSAEQTKAGVRYKEPKSGKARKIALSATAAEELKAWRVRQAQELLRLGMRPEADTFVVTTVDGRPLQPRSMTHEWVRLLKAKKLGRVRFHDLRHSHATHLLAANVHPKIASERLGHSTVGITLDLYSHVTAGMQEDAAARIDAAFRAVEKK